MNFKTHNVFQLKCASRVSPLKIMQNGYTHRFRQVSLCSLEGWGLSLSPSKSKAVLRKTVLCRSTSVFRGKTTLLPRRAGIAGTLQTASVNWLKIHRFAFARIQSCDLEFFRLAVYDTDCIYCPKRFRNVKGKTYEAAIFLFPHFFGNELGHYWVNQTPESLRS